MASIYDLKPRFQAFLRPVVKRLAAAGVTANQVTAFAALASLATGLLIYAFRSDRRILLLLPIVLFARMALNAIDGMLAREHNMKSSLGAFLNELGDVLADAALYLPLSFIAGVSPVLVVSVVLLAIISEMTGVLAAQIGGRRRYEGPMGKSDRAFAFGLLGLLMGLGLGPGRWVNIVLFAMIVLICVTIVNRCRKSLREAS